MSEWKLVSYWGSLREGDPDEADAAFHAEHLNDVLRLNTAPFFRVPGARSSRAQTGFVAKFREELMRLKNLARIGIFAIVISTLFEQPAQAQTVSAWGKVTMISAGWSQDTEAVFVTMPLVNPNGCRVTTGGYATDPADPGHGLFHNVLLAALLSGKDVQLIVLGCAYEKPKIIGVNIR